MIMSDRRITPIDRIVNLSDRRITPSDQVVIISDPRLTPSDPMSAIDDVENWSADQAASTTVRIPSNPPSQVHEPVSTLTFAQPKIARVFKTGRSQAVRLAKESCFDTDTVLVHREGSSVILEPVREWPAEYVKSFAGIPDDFGLLKATNVLRQSLSTSREDALVSVPDAIIMLATRDESWRRC